MIMDEKADSADSTASAASTAPNAQEGQEKAIEAVEAVDAEGETSSAEVVFKVTSHDCLMGRGAAVIGNEGNRRFRKLIQKYKVEYDATRIRQEKDRIARKIVDTITARGGRFLRKIETAKQAELFKVPADKPAWVVVNQLVVLQKVKQAFRDDRRSMEEERANHARGGARRESVPLISSGSAAAHGLSLGATSATNSNGNLKNPLGTDSLLGLGPPGILNPSLMMMQPGLGALGGAGLFQGSPQGLLGAGTPLHPSLANQILAMRQAAMDPMAALRRQAILEQALLEERQRALLLQQALAQQQTAATSATDGPTGAAPSPAAPPSQELRSNSGSVSAPESKHSSDSH